MKATRILLIESACLLATAAVVFAQAAPAPGDASLTVDRQIHLGAESALLKEGSLLFWEASTNTGIGRNALSSNTSGGSNTAVGNSALTSNTTGIFNTAVGDIALQSNYNGERNTAVGAFALANNVAGSYNTAIGLAAMEYNTSGSFNTAVGLGALGANIGDNPGTPGYYEGSYNAAVGNGALGANTFGSYNTATGVNALRSNTEGYKNTALGFEALKANISGSYNTALGEAALSENIDGSDNTAVGETALRANTSGGLNVAVGVNTLLRNETGSGNTAVGHAALFNSTTGSGNIALGTNAGVNLGYEVTTPLTSMSDNIFIGNEGETDEEQVIRIGSGQNTTFIAGIDDETLTVSAFQVCVEPTGQLGRCNFPSSREYKDDIQDMGAGTEGLLALRPVTFRFKDEVAGQETGLQFGLIAEEVAAVFPELVSFDDEGQPAAVKYRFLSSLLLNELQKQASEIQRMKARLERLESAELPHRGTKSREAP
jgi:hypothetical protein